MFPFAFGDLGARVNQRCGMFLISKMSEPLTGAVITRETCFHVCCFFLWGGGGGGGSEFCFSLVLAPGNWGADMGVGTGKHRSLISLLLNIDWLQESGAWVA